MASSSFSVIQSSPIAVETKTVIPSRHRSETIVPSISVEAKRVETKLEEPINQAYTRKLEALLNECEVKDGDIISRDKFIIPAVNKFITCESLEKTKVDLVEVVKHCNERQLIHYTTALHKIIKSPLLNWSDDYFLPTFINNLFHILYLLIHSKYASLNLKDPVTKKLRDQKIERDKIIQMLKMEIVIAQYCYQLACEMSSIPLIKPKQKRKCKGKDRVKDKAKIRELVARIQAELNRLPNGQEIVVPIGSNVHQCYVVLRKILEDGVPKIVVIIHNSGIGFDTKYPDTHVEFPGEPHHEVDENGMCRPAVLGSDNVDGKGLTDYLFGLVHSYGETQAEVETKLYDHASNLYFSPDNIWLYSSLVQENNNCVTYNYDSALLSRHTDLMLPTWIRRRETQLIREREKPRAMSSVYSSGLFEVKVAGPEKKSDSTPAKVSNSCQVVRKNTSP